MNRVRLIGDVVWPVDVRRDRLAGRTIGKTLVAVPRDVQGMDFVPVVLHDREAVSAAKYLGEGSKVAIDGYIHGALLAARDAHGDRVPRLHVVVIANRTTSLELRQPRAGESL